LVKAETVSPGTLATSWPLFSLLAGSPDPPVQIDKSVQDIASVIFSPEGNFLQEMLIEEGVAAVDALSRVAVTQLLNGLGPLSLPITWPMQMFLGARKSGGDLLSDEDHEALTIIQRIVDLVHGRGTPPVADLADGTRTKEALNLDLNLLSVAQELASLRPLAEGLMPCISPGAAAFARRFAARMARRIIQRVADDLQQITFGPLFARPS